MQRPEIVRVYPSSTTTKTYNLVSIPNCDNSIPYGSIAINSLPEWGYEVYLDDVDMGYGTPMIQDINEGEHRVRLEAEGYIPQTKTVFVAANIQTQVDFVLIPEDSFIGPILEEIIVPTEPILINAPVEVSSRLTYRGDAYPLTAIWRWDAEDPVIQDVAPGWVVDTRTFNAAGIYPVTIHLVVTDGSEPPRIAEQELQEAFIVVYDPSGGFVTGGGWITSPEGAYTPDPTLTGKATFGFVSKYVKGAKEPSGSAEFQFHVADLNFKSTSYEWLVVNGAKAQFKGTGTINGAGSYGFLISAIDGQERGGGDVDKFRIKIWIKDTDQVVYDNQEESAIEGGSILVKK
jgi:PEGA domain.